MNISLAQVQNNICNAWGAGNDYMASVISERPDELAVGMSVAAFSATMGRIFVKMPGTNSLMGFIALIGLGNPLSVGFHQALCGSSSTEGISKERQNDWINFLESIPTRTFSVMENLGNEVTGALSEMCFTAQSYVQSYFNPTTSESVVNDQESNQKSV